MADIFPARDSTNGEMKKSKLGGPRRRPNFFKSRCKNATIIVSLHVFHVATILRAQQCKSVRTLRTLSDVANAAESS